MEVRIWLLIHFLAALTGGGMLTAMADEKVTSEYYTAFLNISFLDETRGVLHTERTETGRFSSSSVKEVAGIVVELVSNLTETIIEGSDNQVDHVLDYSACKGPYIPNWPIDKPWIALIRRGKCTFNSKIANALSLNASGVLVYDNGSGGGVLQSMKVEPFAIPSVFTYNWKGLELSKLIKNHGPIGIDP